MASGAQVANSQAEAEVLDSLRQRFEGEGFAFTAHPKKSQLPAFLGSYIPDAIARKPGLNVVIEVKGRSTSSSTRMLTGIRKLFEGHPDWRLHVALQDPTPRAHPR